MQPMRARRGCWHCEFRRALRRRRFWRRGRSRLRLKGLSSNVCAVILILQREGMPEMAKDAPKLDEVGARLKEAWIARWISNPKALRPDTSMPNVFHGKAGSTVKEAADIAAHLATLGAAAPDAMKEPAADAIVAGGRIVARLGCVGCHTLADKEIGADPARVP